MFEQRCALTGRCEAEDERWYRAELREMAHTRFAPGTPRCAATSAVDLDAACGSGEVVVRCGLLRLYGGGWADCKERARQRRARAQRAERRQRRELRNLE